MSIIGNEIIKTNHQWELHNSPLFTIITPVYNRRKTIRRTICSVLSQTFKDFEYIIIDDGSTESIDDIIEDLMDEETIPVLYIKKNNGGVHTARNAGYRYARGELVICIDSDDELTPQACDFFRIAWEKVQNKEEYWQIKGLCVNDDGKLCSSKFPENINSLSLHDALPFFSLSGGEQLGCRVVSILKANLFPEPKGITFVNECVVWLPLEKKYKSIGINDVVRIYHNDGENKITSRNKKSLQSCKNALWNCAHELNNRDIFITSTKKHLVTILRYMIMRHLASDSKNVVPDCKLKNLNDNILVILLWLPSLVASIIYKVTRQM